MRLDLEPPRRPVGGGLLSFPWGVFRPLEGTYTGVRAPPKTMAADTFVERSPVDVLRVRADLSSEGPAAAFERLEAKLSGLRGRRFYGAIHSGAVGLEYFACVERRAEDDPRELGAESFELPGGLYVRRKIEEWPDVVRRGQLPVEARDMIARYAHDPSRPELEFYRSSSELHLLVPVLNRQVRGGP